MPSMQVPVVPTRLGDLEYLRRKTQEALQTASTRGVVTVEVGRASGVEARLAVQQHQGAFVWEVGAVVARTPATEVSAAGYLTLRW